MRRHDVADRIDLYATSAHRDLHSFPTRRSSDLPTSATSTPPEPSSSIMTSRRTFWTVMEPEPSSRMRSEPSTRSEEHTSELQSQSNLVCRLLLEKKKLPPAPPHVAKY